MRAQVAHICCIAASLQQQQVIKGLHRIRISCALRVMCWPDMAIIAAGQKQSRKGASASEGGKNAQRTSKMSMEGWWMVHTTVRPVLTVLRTERITMAAARASSPARTHHPA